LTNWIHLETFETEGEGQIGGDSAVQKRSADSLQFDPSGYEREVARNTFLNRFECDPALTPYDMDNSPKRTANLSIVSFKPSTDSSTRNFYNPQFLKSDTGTFKIVDPFAVKTEGRSMASSVPQEIANRPVADKARQSNRTGDLDRLLTAEPVAALQGGLVVFSSRRPAQGDGINLNGHIVPVGDLSSYNGDVVIVQSWDQASSGVRYHLYSGLDAASVVAGDRVTAGQQIGRGAGSALRHELRQQTVHGPLLEVEARKGN